MANAVADPFPLICPGLRSSTTCRKRKRLAPAAQVLVRIGEEVSEKLDIVPAKIQVIRHIRPKYACRTCEGYLQTDGYSGYEAPGEREGLCHLGCMAHVRRKFGEVEKTAGKKGKGGTAMPPWI